MLKTLLGAIALAGMLLHAGAAPAQSAFRPVAVVNDSAITGFDLDQRAKLMSLLGYPTSNPEALRSAALDRLVEDRLKTGEAKRLGIEITPEMVSGGIEELAKNAKVTPEEFRKVILGRGVSEQALNDMVGAEMVWREVVKRRFNRRIEPTDAEIDAEIALTQQQIGVSYHIAELGLPLNDRGRSEAETRALAQRLYADLSAGGDFAKAVKTYSRAPSAKRGGDVGWVPTNRMPPELAIALTAIEVGQVTQPLDVSGGITILKLLDRRDEGSSGIDSADPALRDKVRQGLANQQTARLADGLLQELRRDALIEMR